MSNERTSTYVEEVGICAGYDILRRCGYDPCQGESSMVNWSNYIYGEECLGICPDASDIDLMFVLLEAQKWLCGMGDKSTLAKILRAAADVADGRR